MRELNAAHTSQAFQAAGLWFGHLGWLPEATVWSHMVCPRTFASCSTEAGQIEVQK